MRSCLSSFEIGGASEKLKALLPSERKIAYIVDALDGSSHVEAARKAGI